MGKIKFEEMVKLLFILLSHTCIGQTRYDYSIPSDTIPCYLVLLDTTHYWNYYNKSGSVAWRNVKGYDATLIPTGGKAVQGTLITTTTLTDDGYKVVTLGISTYLDKNKQPLNKKYISAWPFDIPKNGF